MRTFRTLAASAVLAVVASLVGVAQPATAEVDTTSTVDPYNVTFSLRNDMTSLSAGLNLIDSERASVKRSVSWVMDHANRTRAPICHPTVYQPVVDQGAYETGFCWDQGDTSSDDDDGAWIPQGITTTRDALSANYYDGHQLVGVGWYRSGQSRLSLVDWDAGFPNTYRHILFVEPTGNTVRYRNADSHAGGMMWYGNLLYVADSANRGFRIFTFDNLYSADTSAFCSDSVGRVYDGSSSQYRYCASGYAYIMPQVGWVRAPASDPNYLRVSTISLDRSTTPDSFVVAEFASPNEGTQSDDQASRNRLHPRVVRWPLDYTTRLPSTGSSSEAYVTNIQKVQGAASRNGTIYLASSNGESSPGTLRSWNPLFDTVRRTDWVIGPESLSYWGGSPELLWTCTEWANKRVVVAVRPGDLDL